MLALDTQVAKYRIVESGNPAITLVENPIRPAGGGQPADHGTIVTGEGQIHIEQVIKSDGETWLYLPTGNCRRATEFASKWTRTAGYACPKDIR